MNAGLFRFEMGHAGSGTHSVRPATMAAGLAAISIAGLAAWMVFSNQNVSNGTGQQPAEVNVAAAAPIQPADFADANPAPDASSPDAAQAPAEAAPVEALKISSQSWRRGGLGSNALVTLTLRNDNAYAVRDIGILCAFSRADGSLLTERRQTIHETVKMKGRKTFARLHVGFVNVNAARAKCSLVDAGRV